MKPLFELIFTDRAEYEYLAALILFDGQRLCEVSKENGNDKMEIEFLTDIYLFQKETKMRFSLAEFQRVLIKASEELKLCS
jgi:hypothetical protein